MRWRDRLDRWWYPEFGERWDIAQFRTEVLALLRQGMRVLDLGAGRGALPELDFSGQGAEIWGADVDPVITQNAHLDQAFVTLPTELTGVPDNSIDLAICCSVLEHVDEPELLLREIRRVLKPGGRFFAKTPNRHHYMPLIASLTPTWFHKRYNRWRGRDEEDTFPTRYRLNSRAAVTKHARMAGFEIERLWTVEGRPEYLRLTPPTYFAGYLYERLVNGLRLHELKGVLLIQLRVPVESVA